MNMKQSINLIELKNKFCKCFPSMKEQIQGCRTSGEYDLIILLKDGTRILFDGFDSSYTKLPKPYFNMESEGYKKEFAYCLKRAIKREDISQYELSRVSGVPQPTISRYLSAKHLPSFEHMCKLANALHCSIADFRYY